MQTRYAHLWSRGGQSFKSSLKDRVIKCCIAEGISEAALEARMEEAFMEFDLGQVEFEFIMAYSRRNSSQAAVLV